MVTEAGQGHVLTATVYPRWFGAGMILAAAVVIGTGFVGYYGLQNSQPGVAHAGFGVSGAVVVAAILVSGLSKRVLQIDRDGIQARFRGRTTLIRWSEPHDFYYREVAKQGVPGSEKVSVRTTDGRRIDVDNVPLPAHPNVKLPKLVEQYSVTANWPKIMARLQAGEDVAFGAVSVSQDRIKVGDDSYPRAHAVTLQVERGQLKVGTQGKWSLSKVSVRDVANYPCLLKAIGQVTAARQLAME